MCVGVVVVVLDSAQSQEDAFIFHSNVHHILNHPLRFTNARITLYGHPLRNLFYRGEGTEVGSAGSFLETRIRLPSSQPFFLYNTNPRKPNAAHLF